MSRRARRLEKPKALRKGSRLAIVAPSSPAEPAAISAGLEELRRLGFQVDSPHPLVPHGYFAGGHRERMKLFSKPFHEKKIDGVVATRGGYGANYLIDQRLATSLQGPKCLLGYSDLNIIQLLLLEVRQWVGFYGPMVAAGFNNGSGRPEGYDEQSFWQAVGETRNGWEIPLLGECLFSGNASGRIVGGCLTLLQTTLGTGWDPDTEDAILVLEDRGMKPYQVDRALRHLQLAGKLAKIAGVVLGDFPDCDAPVAGGPTARDVCKEILAPLRVPVVYGAPIGHTKRPMLTIPLGARAKLHAKGEGKLEILEPAVVK